MKRNLSAGLAVFTMVAVSSSLAAPFGSFDARSVGMGGAGVAAGTIGNAAFFNPAMLAAQRAEDDFSLLLPVASAAPAATLRQR